MQLHTWLSLNGKTQKELAAIIRKYPVRVHRILKGSKPTKEEMALIYEATAGQVTANDFYNLPVDGHRTTEGSG